MYIDSFNSYNHAETSEVLHVHVHIKHQNEEKVRLTVCASQAGLGISETPRLMGFSHSEIFRVYTEWCKKTKQDKTNPVTGFSLLMRKLTEKFELTGRLQ